MSLLFEHAVEQFSPARASLCAVDESDLNTTDTDVPVRPIGEFTRHHASLDHPEQDWTCIPLHGRADAEPTDEFVAYTDHDVRGEIFLVERDGDYEPIAAEEFGRTQVADRIRFRHSDYLPKSYPPGYDAPIDDHEPPRNPVDGDLLDEFRSYVAEERDATRDGNWESARRQSAQTRYEQGESAIPALTCLCEDDDAYRFRVDPEESRAVGVSGSQTNHRTTRPFGRGESHGIGLVDCWQCQAAGTPILDHVRRPGVVLATRAPAGVSRFGGIVVFALSSRHGGTPFEDVAFTDCPFGYYLVTRADRPLPKDG